jgi:predicted dehydrogenase
MRTMTVDVTIVGGGMIVHDQILPSVYHLQRTGHLGSICVVATRTSRLAALVNSRFQRAFPGQTFRAIPALGEPSHAHPPQRWREVLAEMPAGNLVIVATPDELHYEMVCFALERNQHVLCVKPLVHRHEQARHIADLAHQRGLYVGVEYHKRFDRRSLEARDHYTLGRFGELVCGQAWLIEPYYYRHSNFQNWFTTDKTDAFTYIGCHYVDLVYFITGLRPTDVSLRGVERRFPNGNAAFMWTAAQVGFENGAILSITNGLGYPDRGAGTNDQGMTLYCEGENMGAIIQHDDQYRGVGHGYVDEKSGAYYRYINPDYFRLVPWTGDGLRPVGYGYDSIEAHVLAALSVKAAGEALLGDEGLKRRQALLDRMDKAGLLATPRNSSINELVVEAGRWSIMHGGERVSIEYSGSPQVIHA